MQESVQLDFIGETHVDFDDTHFIFVRSGYSRIQLPVHVRNCHSGFNVPLPYDDVRWIGTFVKRQWWLLIPGIFFTAMGPVWAATLFGNWGPFVVSVVWFALLGIVPLILFARGRTFLGIATMDRVVVLPMDRQRKKVARILGLLKQFCQSTETQWQLEGSSFDIPDSLDTRPPTGRAFDRKRHIRITATASLYGAANLLMHFPEFRIIGIAIYLLIGAAIIRWSLGAIFHKPKS